MTIVLKALGASVLLLFLALGGAIADMALNKGRIVFGLMGQDELMTACQPVLARAVSQKGLDPETLVLGDLVSMKVSTDEGEILERKISIVHDGEKYSGSFTCRRLNGQVSLTWKMSVEGAAAKSEKV